MVREQGTDPVPVPGEHVIAAISQKKHAGLGGDGAHRNHTA